MSQLEHKSNYFIAVNTPYHKGKYTFDGNATLFKDNQPILAIAQERVSLKKYDGAFREAINYLLNAEQITPADLQKIVVSGFALPVKDNETFIAPICADICTMFGLERQKIEYVNSHHEAHALQAVSQSHFDECLVCVVDNLGSVLNHQQIGEIDLVKDAFEQTSLYRFKDNKLTLLERLHDKSGDVGFGRAFSIVTRYIGFSSYHNAGKTMGISSYCQKNELPVDTQKLVTYCEYSDDGLEDLHVYFEGVIPHFKELKFEDKARLAKWIQNYYQENLSNLLLKHIKETGIKQVCISGGVALNSVANTHIQNSLGVDVFVPSSPGDAGISLGVGLSSILASTGVLPKLNKSPYWGRPYHKSEILNALEKKADVLDWEFLEDHTLIERAAEKLVEDDIIFWFQGRSEFGPRALGNRSILANPKNGWTKDKMNHLVKKREWFRPFAPSIMETYVEKYFKTTHLSPYMMKIATVQDIAYNHIPACIHTDGTSRYHTVNKMVNPKFHSLIDTFRMRTGIPVVMNTSFNLADMPIVEKPEDAIYCFLISEDVNYLFIDNFFITKKQTPAL